MPKVVRFEKGSFELGGQVSEDQTYIDKPVVMVYAGKFNSLDGEVEIKDEDINKFVSNHNSMLARISRLAAGQSSMKYNPPIQLDHSTSARDTVGRLVGDVRADKFTYENDAGEKVEALAMFGTARIMGKDNIERVQDGRWTHLSGGLDLENHKISELTITPFPAAANASFLSRARMADQVLDTWNYEGWRCAMYKVDDEYCCLAKKAGRSLETKMFSSKSEARTSIESMVDDEGEAELSRLQQNEGGEMPQKYGEMKKRMETYGKAREHMLKHKKMSEEDTEKRLEEMNDDDAVAMAAEYDAELSRLAEEENKNKDAELKRLAANKENKDKVVKLTKEMRTTAKSAQLTARKSQITARLSHLAAKQKVTPAEIKALNVDELAGKSDEAVDAALATYEKRQPVIDTGMYGTTKALSAGQLQTQLKQLGAEVTELKTRLGMPSKRDDALKRLKDLGLTEADLDQKISVGSNGGSNEEDAVELSTAYDELKKLISEGKDDEAKAKLAKMRGATIVGNLSSDENNQLSALAADVKKLQTNLEEIIQLAAPALGLTEAEIKGE